VPATRCHRRHGRPEGWNALDIEVDYIVISSPSSPNPIGTESRLAIRTDTILGKKGMRSGAGLPALRARCHLAGGKHDSLSDLYAFFDVHQGRIRLGHRHRQGVVHVLSHTIDHTYRT